MLDRDDGEAEERVMDAWALYKEMCASLRADGLSTAGMYQAYLIGELRKARRRIEELEAKNEK